MRPLRWVVCGALWVAVAVMRNARAVLLAAGVALFIWLLFQLYVVAPLVFD